MANRVAPGWPVQAFQTFQIASPRQTHTRPATCAEVDCDAHRYGWRTTVPADSPQAAYIRAECSPVDAPLSPAAAAGRRRYREVTDVHETVAGAGLPAGQVLGVIVFEFPAGQTCFAEHRVKLDRPELYVVRDGDWRTSGDPTARHRQHTKPEHWVDEFATHQDNVATARQKG